jgi:hypothetical protein
MNRSAAVIDLDEYRRRLNAWHQERELSLRRENGWLALAGLSWLNAGRNRVGSDPGLEIVLPARAPKIAGYLDVEGHKATWSRGEAASAVVNGLAAATAALGTDKSESPSFITFDDMTLLVIERGDRLAVRIWDNQRVERRTEPPRQWFDLNPNFRVPAAFSAYSPARSSPVPDALGGQVQLRLDACVTFALAGRQWSLDVFREDDDSLTLHFWDPTGLSETYPSGRYLVIDAQMEQEGILDFNFAYSPPCAFTPFATCVFSPEQNRLDVRIEAGELYRRH